jgi:hypothetical protein
MQYSEHLAFPRHFQIKRAPGLRKASLGAIHLAYVRDPDGNKLCAMHQVKQARPARAE